MGAADLVSAAVHASLVGEHLAEAPVLAVLFALASVVLVVLGVAALRRFASRWLVLWNGVLLAGLVGGYLVSRVVGIPVVGEGVEPVDVAGVTTQVIELFALAILLKLAAAEAACGLTANRKYFILH